ncbi:MAG: nuclear transport factor 2 family protein, partial [Polyangiaceae bacterium]
GQSDVTIVRGEPIVTQSRAAIELWVTMRVPALNPTGDNMVTLIETNILYFDTSGLCCRNVEYWNLLTGAVAPPPRWGHVR